jgi:hypothetical protein
MTPDTADGWKEIKSSNDNIVRWETPGQTHEGVFQGGKLSGPKSNLLFAFLGADGKVWRTWETYDLKGKLENVPTGRYVRVTYKGLSGKMKTFSVQTKAAPQAAA